MIGAVDIGGTKIAVGMVDDAGQVVYSSEFATEQVKNDPASGIAKIAEIINHSSYPCEGVGIGCTGPVFSDLGTLGYVECLPGWTGIHLVEELESACHKPVVLENDANANAADERQVGQIEREDLGFAFGQQIVDLLLERGIRRAIQRSGQRDHKHARLVLHHFHCQRHGSRLS